MAPETSLNRGLPIVYQVSQKFFYGANQSQPISLGCTATTKFPKDASTGQPESQGFPSRPPKIPKSSFQDALGHDANFTWQLPTHLRLSKIPQNTVEIFEALKMHWPIISRESALVCKARWILDACGQRAAPLARVAQNSSCNRAVSKRPQTTCLDKCHILRFVPPSGYLTTYRDDVGLKFEQDNSQMRASAHQTYQAIDRPWVGGRSDARQREQAATDLTPMEKWQKESTRNQPYHNIEAVAHKGKNDHSTGNWGEARL
ncbi:hypothetical protein G7Y89_g4184 [Cudoniella acicularis]|uniref:Uncharacterized protein n=1 Tax=Cudoniella acicularis TaxID=354080 RepID=A0A8H4RPZ5_9HELO|nr:hypothetical protein G7Y89_g4184 [Cudoniella acicularis]